MEEVSTMLIRDAESTDEAVIIVRHDKKNVALSISLRSDGDVELIMSGTDVERVIQALKTAVDYCAQK